MRKEIEKLLEKAVLELEGQENTSDFVMPEIIVDSPKDERFGDYSSNIAMVLAGVWKKNPMEIAESIKNQALSIKYPEIEKLEVAKPGYVNFYLSKEYFSGLVTDVNEKEEEFGNGNIGANKYVQVEFISSNPTGPIHLGNARGGPLGDSLANVLKKAGFRVDREFYVNDFGNQIEVLGHSVLKDEAAQYKGDYVDDLADELSKSDIGNDPLVVGNWAANIILDQFIKPTCEKMGISFDRWFSEKTLHESGEVDHVLEVLKKKDLTYEKDGAIWYKSTQFGDDKDRVLVRTNGKKTYFAVDSAYHKNKFERGYDKVINIWGADHFGDVVRVKSVAENVLGHAGKLDFILTQMVRIIKDGQELKMSKRKGIYFAMDDLLEEVGKDAVRFIFTSYAPTSHINFDINLALERSEKNPVYYVQYAHARICSIIRKAESLKPEARSLEFSHPKEVSLIRELNKFPELIEEVAKSYEVHKLPHYAIRLADKFHSFYGDCRVIDETNAEQTSARLKLINAVKIVLGETLGLIGVDAPESM